MNELNKVVSTNVIQSTFTLRDPETDPNPQHTHTLNEVQRRAYRIHQRHGGIYGGYTLEDRLEAEPNSTKRTLPVAEKRSDPLTRRIAGFPAQRALRQATTTPQNKTPPRRAAFPRQSDVKLARANWHSR